MCVCLQMSFHQMMRFCVYLLEYVCSRGPLRPILCPALLHPRFPCPSFPHLDAASLPHPASPWLARLARCTGDLLVCMMIVVRGCNGGSAVFAGHEPAICGYDSLIRHAPPTPVLAHQPTSGFVCFAPVACGCVFGGQEEGLMC